MANLSKIDKDVLHTRDEEIRKLRLLVMGYHKAFMSFLDKAIEEGCEDDICNCCTGYTSCDGTLNETCIYSKLTDAGNNWVYFENEQRLIEQANRSFKELFPYGTFEKE